MTFPAFVSFTLTNRCNLQCRMCGQWSDSGYMRGPDRKTFRGLDLEDWNRLADETAGHGLSSVLLRGGEPFLFPGILELLEHLSSRGIFTSIDTNGTLLKRYAAEIVRIKDLHLTVSVDGPEPVHDRVRGVVGTFSRIREGLAALRSEEDKAGRRISKSITFTISPYSVSGLGAMPDVARDLKIDTLCIVPYYFVLPETGSHFEREIREHTGRTAFSWRGFCRGNSGVDKELFLAEYRKYKASLGRLKDYPYMPLSEDEYIAWFSGIQNPPARQNCSNAERLIDIQPGGDANACVDFPDWVFGNALNSTIEEIWNGERAVRFREYRRRRTLAVCGRCGAGHMADVRS